MEGWQNGAKKMGVGVSVGFAVSSSQVITTHDHHQAGSIRRGGGPISCLMNCGWRRMGKRAVVFLVPHRQSAIAIAINKPVYGSRIVNYYYIIRWGSAEVVLAFCLRLGGERGQCKVHARNRPPPARIDDDDVLQQQ